MTEIKPRFEFRTFAQNFGKVVTAMRTQASVEGIRESSEIYIMSTGNNENNTKIRDAKMDIKVFVQNREGLEQWNPRMKGVFPMTAVAIRDEVFPAFGVPMPTLERDKYTLDQYLQEVIAPHPDLAAVNVFKQRFAFTINGCIAEHARLLINGAAIETVSIESVDVPAILEAIRRVHLNGYENVNYLMAIKRIIGMEKMPDPWNISRIEGA